MCACLYFFVAVLSGVMLMKLCILDFMSSCLHVCVHVRTVQCSAALCLHMCTGAVAHAWVCHADPSDLLCFRSAHFGGSFGLASCRRIRGGLLVVCACLICCRERCAVRAAFVSPFCEMIRRYCRDELHAIAETLLVYYMRVM